MTDQLAVRPRRQIFDDLIVDIRNTKPGVAVDRTGDDLRDISFAASGGLAESNHALKRSVDESFDDTASLAALKKRHAHRIGAPDPGSCAHVNVVTTGTAGSTWSTTDTLVARDTRFRYQPVAPGTMPAAETTTIELVALTIGDAGALADGAVLIWEAPPTGIGAAATTTGDPTGGTDPETADEYRARVFDYYQNPEAGGTLRDWERWAQGVTGVGRARAVADRRALGTTDVAVLDHEGDALDASVLANVQTELDARRPPGCKGSLAVTPTFEGVTIQRRLDMAAGYGFSSFAAKTVGDQSSTTRIHTTDSVADVAAGDWVAVKVSLRGRNYYLAREVYAVETGVTANNFLNLKTALPAAPAAGVAARPGCPTFDAIAASVQAYLATIRSGDPFYNGACDDAIRTNPEVKNAVAVAPAADVVAVVNAFTFQQLTVADIILEPAT